MEPATAFSSTEIRHHSPPTIAANFYWIVNVVRHFSEQVSSINSFDHLDNPSKKILLLPFFRWVNWDTEGWITYSSSHREAGILNQAIWHQITYAIVSIPLCSLAPAIASWCFTYVCAPVKPDYFAVLQAHSYSLNSKLDPLIMHCNCPLNLPCFLFNFFLRDVCLSAFKPRH